MKRYVRGISDRKIILLYGFVLLLCIPILIAAHRAGRNTDARLKGYEVKALQSGWYTRDEQHRQTAVTLPVKNSQKTGRTFSIHRTLTDEECNNHNYLMLLTYHSSVRISIGDRLVYAFGTHKDSFLMAPSAYHFFYLDSSYAGQQLTVSFSSESAKFQGTAEMIYIGDRASELIMILRSSATEVSSYLLLLTISIVFLLVWLYLHLFSKNVHDNSLLFLALTALFLFAGGIIDTRIPQFFFPNLEALSIFSYEVLIFMEMSVIAYFLCSSNEYVATHTRIITPVPVLNFILTNALFLLRIEDLEDSLYITHICLVIVAVSEIIFHLRSGSLAKRRTFGRYSMINPKTLGFILFAVTVVIDVVRYYFGTNNDRAAATRIGAIVYILLLGMDSLQNRIDIATAEKQSQAYKQLALHDALTGLGNRTAYQETLAYLNAGEERRRKSIIVMFDLNDLKKVNDRLGHAEGDQYIQKSAAFINQYFRDFSTLYRIGGDEFALLCTLRDPQRFHDAFAQMQADCAALTDHSISFASGYAQFLQDLDQDLYDTVRRADQMMYTCKKQMKTDKA